MPRHRHRVFDNHGAPAIGLQGQGPQQRIGSRPRGPDQRSRANFAVAQDHFAGPAIVQPAVEPERDAAHRHALLRIASQRFAEFRQDAVSRVNQNNLQILGSDIGVIRQNAARKIVESARQLDARESAARDDERELLTPQLGIRFAVRLLEHVDHLIANANGVQQRLKIERKFLDVLQAKIIRNSAQREDHLVVNQTPDAATFHGYLYAPAIEIHLAHASSNYLCAAQAGPQRRADVAGLQAASGYLGQHRRE